VEYASAPIRNSTERSQLSRGLTRINADLRQSALFRGQELSQRNELILC